MKIIIIDKNNQNQRLDKFLLKYLNNAPKSFIYKMLRKKNIKYNDKKAEGNEILKENDEIKLFLAEETIGEFQKEKIIEKVKINFDVVYEDPNVVICNKPSGLLTQRDDSGTTDTLNDQALYYLSQKNEYNPANSQGFTPSVCNRLDRNTSGIVIVGKNFLATQTINKMIQNNGIEKYYLTIVKGCIKEPKILKGYLYKDEIENKVFYTEKCKEGCKEIETHYKPIKSNGKYTLLEIKLITGRSHQIRLHLSSIGNPIIGDTKYGDNIVNDYFRKTYKLKDQLLQAYKVKIINPIEPLIYLKNKTFETKLEKIFNNIKSELFL